MSRTINIDFAVRERMPIELMSIAIKQGLDCKRGDIVAIKTVLEGTSLTYKFEVIKPTPEGIRDYMEKLAHQDGITDWNRALKRAFLAAFFPEEVEVCSHGKTEKDENMTRCVDCGIVLGRW